MPDSNCRSYANSCISRNEHVPGILFLALSCLIVFSRGVKETASPLEHEEFGIAKYDLGSK